MNAEEAEQIMRRIRRPVHDGPLNGLPIRGGGITEENGQPIYTVFFSDPGCKLEPFIFDGVLVKGEYRPSVRAY